MDYHKMSLVELKQAARDHKPKIKQYYIKSRKDLIELLSMTELPSKFVIEKKKISELRIEARNKGYNDIWKLKKSELIELLYPSPKENNQNHNHAQKHDDPK